MSVDPPTFKADLVRRLNCTEGHLQGIMAMVERGADCASVIHQLRAVQGALREVNHRVLKHHLEVCMREQFQQSNLVFRERYIDEIVALYQRLGISAR